MVANDNAVTCALQDITLAELIASAIGKDASGKPYLRYYETTNVAGSKFFACDGIPPDFSNMPSVFANLFALDANGDISLRVAKAT